MPNTAERLAIHWTSRHSKRMTYSDSQSNDKDSGLKQRQVFARAVLSYPSAEFKFALLRASMGLSSESKHFMAFKGLVDWGFVEDLTPDLSRGKTYKISDRPGLSVYAGLKQEKPDIIILPTSLPTVLEQEIREAELRLRIQMMESHIKATNRAAKNLKENSESEDKGE